MSHFCVLVVGDDVEGQLDPYNENLEAEPSVDDYYTPDQIMGDLQWIINECEKPERKDDKFYKIQRIHKHTYETWIEDYKKIGWEKFLVKNKNRTSMNTTWFIQWADREIEPDGHVYTTYNPDSKWDWYVIGGRWNGGLLHKNGHHVNEAIKNEIDIENMEKPKSIRAAKCWDEWQKIKTFPQNYLTIHGMKRSKIHTDFAYEYFGWMPLNRDFELLKSMSRDAYIACQSIWVPYALLWNGEWYEKGRMGWWGISTMEEHQWSGIFKELWSQIPDDELVTLVDCHI